MFLHCMTKFPHFSTDKVTQMTNNNPYVQQLLEKGYTAQECRKPAAKKQFPMNIHGRIYHTQKEYDDAIADFLNGF